MELTDETTAPTTALIVTIAVLAVITVALIAQIYIIADAIDLAEGGLRDLLARLAWLSVALLGLTSVLVFWMAVRLLRMHFRPSHLGEATPYVDAWALAGERFRLDEHDDKPPSDEDQPPPSQPE